MKFEEIIEETKKGATLKIIRLKTESYCLNKPDGETIFLGKDLARAALKQLVIICQTVSSTVYCFPTLPCLKQGGFDNLKTKTSSS